MIMKSCQILEDSKEMLDNTGVHPESYDIAKKLLDMDYKEKDIDTLLH